jgi:penicillin-binding protein 1A
MAFLRSRSLKILAGLAVLATVAGLAGAIAFYVTFLQDLPNLKSVEDYRPPVSSRVLDRDGQHIATFFEERRTLTPLDAVPKHVVMAFVAGEDSTFFEHSGIDYVSILRAAWVNLRAGGEIKQGASTITQQMVKGLLLSPERRFRRKIREMILARRIEQRFSKQDILYLYLNQIYFGHGAYGVGEAAQTYFDKPVGELSVSEAALLAGLPKAPSRFSPYRNPQLAEERRLYVLERMQVDGIIDAATHTAAVADVPQLADAASQDDPYAAYFSEEVRRLLFEKLGSDLVLHGGLTIETSLDSGLQAVAVTAVQTGLRALDRRQGYRGHLRQVSGDALETEVTKLAEVNQLPTEGGREAAGAALRDGERPLVGVVTSVDKAAKSARVSFAPGVDGIVRLADVKWARKSDPKRSPHSIRSITTLFAAGDVAPFVAVFDDEAPGDLIVEASAFRVKVHQDPIVQGALLSIDVDAQEVVAMVGGYEFANSEFNRVTQAKRQPGSAFKPIIYAASLAPRDDVDSFPYTPATIVHDRPIVYTDEESGFVWRPRNYKRSFYGPITLREALARSVNNATVHLFRDIGIDFVIDYARRLGIESPLNRDLSLALGSSGMSLLEVTRAYAVFPSGGRRIVPTFIRRVTDRDGNVLMENVALGDESPVAPERTDPEFVDVAAGAMPSDAQLPPDPDQVISPEEAYLATSLLRAVVEDTHGTGWRLRDLRRPLAGKTGTTNDQADAWFIGFSPQIATGVWVGHDESLFLGYGETGSRAAAPIWVDYMRDALKDRPIRDFAIPDPIVFARIDRKTGLLADANNRDTVFQAFLQGTVPKQTAGSARASSETRRQLRFDSF